MNWKDDIKKFQSSNSKLLYMIFFFSKIEELSDHQKTKLKEYVVLEDEKIFNILSEFESSMDEIKLLEDMKKLYDEEIKFALNDNYNTGMDSSVVNNQEKEENNSNNDEQKNSNSKNSHSLFAINKKKQPLAVNTDESFLKNAMNSIHKRGASQNENTPVKSENSHVMEVSNSIIFLKQLNSPVGNSLLNKKKKQQKMKTEKENSDDNSTNPDQIKASEDEMYKKSFLGRAVGSLREER